MSIDFAEWYIGLMDYSRISDQVEVLLSTVEPTQRSELR